MSLDRRTLRIEFSNETSFRSEYLTNISNGGVFVATTEAIEVRQAVVIEVVLAWLDERVALDGEVVHRVGEEMAGNGVSAGVAIQFELPAKSVRERFDQLLGRVESNERVAKTGRRAAPRTPARLRVRVATADGRERVYRTRDISTSGVLLALDDQPPPPVGEEVGLVLTHPRTGERMELNGAVVRHLKTSDGAVTAAGIEFRTSSARRTEVTNFVNDIRAAEHSRRLGGITGPIAELGIANMLQMFGASSPRGLLIVTRGAEEGTIGFDGGKLHGARLGRRTGSEALRELLAWRDGSFEFRTQLDDDELSGPGDGVPLNAALLDAMCAIDEGARDAEAKAGKPTRARPAPAPADDEDLDLDLDLDLDAVVGADAAPPDSSGKGGSSRAKSPSERQRVTGAAKLDPSLLPPRKPTTAETRAKASAAKAETAKAAKAETAGAAKAEAAKSNPSKASKPSKPASTGEAAAKKPEKKAQMSAEKVPAKGAAKVPAKDVAKVQAKHAAEVQAKGSAKGGGAKAAASPAPARKAEPATTEQRIGPKTRFEIDAALADALRSELGKLEQAVLDLALVGMGVARMVDVIPEPELEVFRALDSLIERGILRCV